MSVGVSRDCQFFEVPPIISGTGKATNFTFCTHIHEIDRNKSPLKISGKVRGHTQGLSKIYRPAIHRAHRAVILAVAQLCRYFSNRAIHPVQKQFFCHSLLLDVASLLQLRCKFYRSFLAGFLRNFRTVEHFLNGSLILCVPFTLWPWLVYGTVAFHDTQVKRLNNMALHNERTYVRATATLLAIVGPHLPMPSDTSQRT